MANARIYRPAKNAMQSGKAHAGTWLLEFEPAERKQPDSLMGWSGSGDMRQQLKMRFASCDDAVAYAEREGIAAEVIAPHEPKRILRNYADRFAVDRVR